MWHRILTGNRYVVICDSVNIWTLFSGSIQCSEPGLKTCHFIWILYLVFYIVAINVSIQPITVMDNIDVHEHWNMCIAKPAMNSGELDDI